MQQTQKSTKYEELPGQQPYPRYISDSNPAISFSANFSPKKTQQVIQPYQKYPAKPPPTLFLPSDIPAKSAPGTGSGYFLPKIANPQSLHSIKENDESNLTDDNFDQLVNNLTSSMGKERAGYKTSEIVVPEMENFGKKVLNLSQEIDYLNETVGNRMYSGSYAGSAGIGNGSGNADVGGGGENFVVVSLTGDTHHHTIPEYQEINYIDTGEYYEIVEINPRPQEKWRNEINNDRYSPFIPKIVRKPHAVVLLDDIFLEKKNPSVYMFPHPYQYELENFNVPDSQLETRESILYADLESTPCNWVSSSENLNKLLHKLNEVNEIAVDLEHHAYRSFQGFTCLIQISTRKEDFLIDAIELRSELHKLNDIFCNPRIVKVFHGADRDVEWLQADFGVYVVNMFDTGQAARVLEFPKYSLAYLLEKYCGLGVDKKYQLADWRIRPLPATLQKYAREDTHYLLWVYDQLRKELLRPSNGTNLLHSVWMRSRDVCLRKYQKEQFNSEGWHQLYERFAITGVTLDARQLDVFIALYDWRDRIARKEDESIRYVLPNNVLWELSLKTPTDAQSILACCKPLPPLVKKYAEDLPLFLSKWREDKYHQTLNLDDEMYGAFIPYSKQHQLQYQYPEGSSLHTTSLVSFHNNKPNLPKPIPTSPDGKRRDRTIPGTVNTTTSTLSTNTTTSTNAPTTTHQLSLPVTTAMRDSPSPVLTTEQLYKHAQWTDDKTNAQVSLMPSKRAMEAKMKEDIYLRGQMSYDLYDSNENDVDFEDEYGNDDLTMDAKSRRKTAAALCNAYAETIQTGMLNLSEMSDNENEEDDIEEEERDEFEEGLESIPSSMDEIYKLSNKTRKQKKNKKKLKRKISPASPTSPLFLKHGEGDGTIDIRAQKRSNEADSQNEYQAVIDFMRSISWLELDEVPPKPAVRQAPVVPAPVYPSSVPNTSINLSSHTSTLPSLNVHNPPSISTTVTTNRSNPLSNTSITIPQPVRFIPSVPAVAPVIQSPKKKLGYESDSEISSSTSNRGGVGVNAKSKWKQRPRTSVPNLLSHTNTISQVSYPGSGNGYRQPQGGVVYYNNSTGGGTTGVNVVAADNPYVRSRFTSNPGRGGARRGGRSNNNMANTGQYYGNTVGPQIIRQK